MRILRLRGVRLLAMPALVCLALPALGAGAPSSSTPANRGKVAHNLSQLPLSFESNRGQFPSPIRFFSRGRGFTLALTDRQAILSTSRRGAESETVRLSLLHANPASTVRGESPLPGITNYFLGSDPARWHTNIPSVAKARYPNVYPGIDLLYYGRQGHLEFDFSLAPQAHPGFIQLSLDGATGVHLDANGDLHLSARSNGLTLLAPVAYQTIAGQRRAVPAAFRLIGPTTLGFALGSYDHALPLVIDPVLVYSTYLGGSFFDSIDAMAVDKAGNAYLTGNADSCDFPTTPGTYGATVYIQACPGVAAGNIVFVTKLNPTGTALVYSTFIGLGTGNAIAVDAAGNAYVAGSALAGYPTTPGAFQPLDNAAGNDGINGFVTKLNSDGTALLYSTYLGGSYGADAVNAIAVDASGNAYVAGIATSTDFPATPGAFQTTDTTPGFNYSFVSKLNPTGTGLLYSTYLVGNGMTGAYGVLQGMAYGIAIDSAGNAYIAGSTGDQSFPVTPGAFQTNYTSNPSDTGLFRFTGYLTKINPSGSALVYSSFLGGDYLSTAQAVAVNSAGEAFVTGWDTGGLITTPGVFQPKSLGLDAFVTKVNAAGSKQIYASFLGGSCTESGGLNGDTGFSIALDALGDAYIGGQTCSVDFPITTGAVQTTNHAKYFFDAFLSEVNPTGSALLYSTYLGGSGDLNTVGDWANAVGLDGSNNVYLAGLTHSNDFPTVSGSFQLTNNDSDGGSGFVAKFTLPANSTPVIQDFTLALSPSTLTLKPGQSGTSSVTITPLGGVAPPVTFSCSGLPAGASCLFDPASTSASSGAVSATLTIQTQASAELLPGQQPPSPALPVSIAAALAGFVLWPRRKCPASLLLLALIAALGCFTACGGSSAGTGGRGTGPGGGTGTHDYTVTVTGSANSATHSTSLTLTLE